MLGVSPWGCAASGLLLGKSEELPNWVVVQSPPPTRLETRLDSSPVEWQTDDCAAIGETRRVHVYIQILQTVFERQRLHVQHSAAQRIAASTCPAFPEVERNLTRTHAFVIPSRRCPSDF